MRCHGLRDRLAHMRRANVIGGSEYRIKGAPPNSAFAGRDPFLILQIEKAAAQKRAQQAELETLQRCWQAHGHLMERQSNATRASER